MSNIRKIMAGKRKQLEDKYGKNPSLYSSGEKFVYTDYMGKLRITLARM
jgi:hypothetical protein